MGLPRTEIQTQLRNLTTSYSHVQTAHTT